MNILSLDHAALVVKNLDRSRHFYGTILGMNEEPPAVPGSPVVWFRRSRAHVHLIEETQEGRAAQSVTTYYPDELAVGRDVHLAFEVEDLDATQKHLQASGITLVGGPRPRGDGVQQLYVLDPDGYVIEFFEFPKK